MTPETTPSAGDRRTSAANCRDQTPPVRAGTAPGSCPKTRGLAIFDLDGRREPIREAPPEHVPLVVRTIGATARPRGRGVSPYRLRSQGRCRFHRRSKRLDQDPCGIRARTVPGQKMTAHQLDVFGQTVRRRAVYAVPRGSKSPDGEGDSHEQCTDRIAATR
jgi:hypothetical protein